LNESASLEQLVDKTFMNGVAGAMFRFFPLSSMRIIMRTCLCSSITAAS